jgi:hypothetical protein
MRIEFSVEEIQIRHGRKYLIFVGMIGIPMQRVGQAPANADQSYDGGEEKNADGI